MKTILLLSTAITAYAQCCCEPKDYSFYIKVGTGVSCAQSAHVHAPSPPWNPAVQGYNSGLGYCPIAAFSVGCEVMDLIDLEVNISNRSTFKYRKFQTPTTGGSSYTRKFDLDVTPILFSANLLGRCLPYMNWDLCWGTIYPLVGASAGISNLLITNYRTTGLPPSGDSSPYPSFSAESQYTLRKKLTYTVQAGLEYNHCDSWAISTGYRWFDAGRFKGPQYQRVATGSAVDLDGNEWQMNFKSNEWFFEFKIYI
jgi:opacity protein-like surface antigen